MKNLTTIFLSLMSLFFCLQSNADENLVVATEVNRIIVNYNPNGAIAGRAILYTCENCEPRQVEFTQDTELLINGQAFPIAEIGRKVDWAGVVTVMSHDPNRVTQFNLQ